MALDIIDGNDVAATLKSTLDGSDHVTHHNIDAVIPGTGATALGKATDSVPGATDTGVVTLAIRADTVANQVSADGDYAPLIVGSDGALWTRVTSVSPGSAAGNLGKLRDAVAGATDLVIPAAFIRRDSPTALTPAAGDYEVAQVNANGSQWVQPTLSPTGGLTPYKLVSAATTNATSVKGSAGTLGSIVAVNTHASNIAYLKLYNKASAPTVGTDTPVHVIPLAVAAGGVAITFPTGLNFSTGIAFAITGAMADTDTTAVAANQVAVSLGYV